MVKGLFVTFEGIEGSGKTTQVAKLVERLRACGREVVVVREPGGTPLAEEARRLVLDPGLSPSPAAELFLYLAARADLIERVVIPALERGATVLADRFDWSTRASANRRRGRSGTGWSSRTSASTSGSRRPFAQRMAVPSFMFGRTGPPRLCRRRCGTPSLGGSR